MIASQYMSARHDPPSSENATDISLASNPHTAQSKGYNMPKTNVFGTVTTAQMRSYKLLEHLPIAVNRAHEARKEFASDHPRQREVKSDIKRLRALHYMCQHTGDYGLNMTVEDAELLLKYLPVDEDLTNEK
jgi:hypothetical protein